MYSIPLRVGLFAGGLAAVALCAQAQIVQLNATINAAQETPPNSSPATGSATMLYNVATNTFDLTVTINNFANTATDSHIHEAPVGTAGHVVNALGSETAVYTRTGNTLTASFHGLTYAGNKLTLLQGGSYYNIHSAQFPAGEIRGQLIAVPKRLVANINVAQAQATSSSTINSSAYGAAVMVYDPVANRISLRASLYNFQNTFTASHFHEGAPGVSGAVVTPLGGATTAGVTNVGGGFYSLSFDIPYTGDPIKLLTGGAYVNFHSNAYPAGEIRGQVRATDETPGSRVVNLSARGTTGSGQVLIEGMSVLGPDPVRVLITGKGPSLAAYGVTGVLSDPWLSLYDSSGQLIATNNDVGTVAAGSEMASIPSVPTNPVESALVIVLPPGNYCALLSGNNGASGVGLIEVNDLRVIGTALTADQ